MMRGLLALFAPLCAIASCTTFGSDPGATPVGDGGLVDGGLVDGGDGDGSTSGDGAGPEPSTVVAGLNGVVSDIATSETEVIFMVSPGGIYACPLMGCAGLPPRTIAIAEKPRYLVHLNGMTYWSDEEHGEIRRTDSASGTTGVLVRAATAATGLVSSPSLLWISNGADVVGCPLLGGACDIFVGVATGLAIASDVAHVYFVNATGSIGSIDTVSRSRDAITMAAGVPKPVDLSAAAGFVYLLTTDGRAIRYAQGTETTLGYVPPSIIKDLELPARLTVIADAVFATGGGSAAGRVVTAPVAGGPQSIVASSLDRPTALAGRGDALYVGVAGAIKRIKR